MLSFEEFVKGLDAENDMIDNEVYELGCSYYQDEQDWDWSYLTREYYKKHKLQEYPLMYLMSKNVTHEDVRKLKKLIYSKASEEELNKILYEIYLRIQEDLV